MTAEIDHGLVLNQIGTATVPRPRPLVFDRYADNRATGSFILIDPATNFTAGAGMIIEPGPASSDGAARDRAPPSGWRGSRAVRRPTPRRSKPSGARSRRS